jgi:hypothetical protein
MAILSLPPLIRPRAAFKPALVKNGEEAKVATSSKLDTRKFTLVLASVITLNLVVIATINILMTQDAFTLQRLKSERNTALDAKDAILNEVNRINSPANLAKVAIDMGMAPAKKINYLDYSKLSETVLP